MSFFAGIPSFPDSFCCAATRRDLLPLDSPSLLLIPDLVLRSLLTAIAQNKTERAPAAARALTLHSVQRSLALAQVRRQVRQKRDPRGSRADDTLPCGFGSRALSSSLLFSSLLSYSLLSSPAAESDPLLLLVDATPSISHIGRTRHSGYANL